MASPRPTLVFDGDCAFCSSSARAVVRWVRPQAEVAAWQHLDLDALGLTQEQCQESLRWVRPVAGGPPSEGMQSDGMLVHRAGARAVAAVLLAGRAPFPVLGLVIDSVPVRQPAQWVYGWVARNRYRLPGGTPTCRL